MLYYYLKDLNFEPNILVNFSKDLDNSTSFSIDKFLRNRLEYIDIGKLAIAINILKSESNTVFSTINNINNDNWLKYLMNRLENPSEQLENGAISFITFNYDRLLEQFLFNTFYYDYGV
jgi:hypothetical protein